MKVVIDTNCWFGILPPDAAYGFLLDGLIEGNFSLAVSTDVVLEYREILGKKLRKPAASDFIQILEILPNVERISPSFRFNLIIADPDDNKFVDCAVAANADYIVTDDRHFKILSKIQFPKITTIGLDAFSRLL